MKIETEFAFNELVRITRSGETGTVAAVMRNKRVTEPSYLVEYKAADGRAVDSWFAESELIAVPTVSE